MCSTDLQPPRRLSLTYWLSIRIRIRLKVGIKLTDRNNTPVTLDKPFDPTVDPSITIDADGGSGTFYLKAYYYTWDTDEVDAGAGNATARFTIMQE